MFDLITKDTSPLRRRLIATSFWLLWPDMPHPQEALAYWADLEAGRVPTYPDDKSHQHFFAMCAWLRSHTQLDARAAGLEKLMRGQGCALAIQANLTSKIPDLARQTEELRQTIEQSAPTRKSEAITDPVVSFCLLALVLLAGGALNALSGSQVGQLWTGLAILGASLLLGLSGFLWHRTWRRGTQAATNLKARLERDQFALARLDEIAARGPVLGRLDPAAVSREADEGEAPTRTEDDVHADLTSALSFCSQEGELIDPHYFLALAKALFDRVAMTDQERTAALPIRLLIPLLSRDGCEDVKTGLSNLAAWLSVGVHLKITDYVGEIESFGVAVESDGVVELGGILPGEADLTLFRLPVSKAALVYITPYCEHCEDQGECKGVCLRPDGGAWQTAS